MVTITIIVKWDRFIILGKRNQNQFNIVCDLGLLQFIHQQKLIPITPNFYHELVNLALKKSRCFAIEAYYN